MINNNNTGANSIEEFEKLGTVQKLILVDWIKNHFEPIKSWNLKNSSYGMKGIFERSENGFYITNGAFKGAMLECGFNVKDKNALNWNFNVSRKSLAFIKYKR